MQEGSNLDTVGNCTIFFFHSVKQEGQTVYTNIDTLFSAAVHKLQLAAGSSVPLPEAQLET